jgi:phytoene/squalene synthetase
LEPDGRRVFGMMTATYHAVLEEIARQPRQVLARRIRLTRWQKLRIAARWRLLPPRRFSL